MSDARPWKVPPGNFASVAGLLASWGALVLDSSGEIFVGDLDLITGWSIARPTSGEMLDLELAAPENGSEALEHSSGLLLSPSPSFEPTGVTGPLVRLVLEGSKTHQHQPICGELVELEPGLRVDNCSDELVSQIRRLQTTMTEVTVGRTEDFAGSASYMGSKRELLPFLLGGIGSWAPTTVTFLDLMTGSGVVAGRAAMLWNTVASDAQLFSTYLARAQAGGMTAARAGTLMIRIRSAYDTNETVLGALVGKIMERERELLHSPLPSLQLAREYSRFIAESPRYPDGRGDSGWDPEKEVQKRQRAEAWQLTPYCLMTAYYSNVYVGVEQAVQIDSLRYAIDQLDNDIDKSFAMAALVTAVSQVASAYGGHFAQPWATPERVATAQGFAATVKRRTRSVVHEFEARLYALAAHSARTTRRVEIVEGPWRHALSTLSASPQLEPLVVYLDAPYKRDEYSRYYHVLETLAVYEYPKIQPGNRLPERGVMGGRFASEFSTRSSAKVADKIADVIRVALRNGWRVAWSYSNHADTSIDEVIARISSEMAECTAISAPHKYRRQGRLSAKKEIREYLVLIEPR